MEQAYRRLTYRNKKNLRKAHLKINENANNEKYDSNICVDVDEFSYLTVPTFEIYKGKEYRRIFIPDVNLLYREERIMNCNFKIIILNDKKYIVKNFIEIHSLLKYHFYKADELDYRDYYEKVLPDIILHVHKKNVDTEKRATDDKYLESKGLIQNISFDNIELDD